MQVPNAANESTSLRLARLEELVATQEAALAQERAKVARLQDENEKLRDAYARLRQELELLQRRIFVAKAERIDTAQLELEFANKLADLNALKAILPEGHESLFDDHPMLRTARMTKTVTANASRVRSPRAGEIWPTPILSSVGSS